MLRGQIGAVGRDFVRGWVWDAERPATRVGLVVAVDDKIIGRCLADLFRPDLLKASIGDGRHGFHFKFDPPSLFDAHMISVRREGEGTHIPKSPMRLEPSAALDPVTRRGVEAVMTAAASEADFEDRLGFLLGQVDKLRQRRADFVGGAREIQRRRDQAREAGTLCTSEATPRALVIDSFVPITDHDAGSNAILSHMKSLQRLGYQVSFVPATLRGDAAALESEGIECCLSPWYGSVEEVLRRRAGAFSAVYLHRGENAAAYVALARRHQPKARIIYSVADLHSLREARQARIEGRPELDARSRRTGMLELIAARQADAVITHSTAEAAILRRHLGADGKVYVARWAIAPDPVAASFAQRSGVGFIGHYGHAPNVDAAYWLVDCIMPQVWSLDPTIKCLLAGSDMPDHLRRRQNDGIVALGHAARLGEFFSQPRLTVAPLAYGAGVKGKVLDSLAAGVPCVCTAIAAKGIPLPDILAGHVADDPKALARSIVALHNDAALNLASRDAGLAMIRDLGSHAKVDASLQAALGRNLQS